MELAHHSLEPYSSGRRGVVPLSWLLALSLGAQPPVLLLFASLRHFSMLFELLELGLLLV